MKYPELNVESWPEQAAQLRHDFQERMYGWLPEPERLVFVSESTVDDRGDSEFTLKKFRSSQGIEIDTLHACPKTATRATFVGLNFHGNQTVVDYSAIPLPRNGAYDEPKERGSERETWCVDEILRAGFGLITFCHSDVVRDDPVVAQTDLKRLSDRPLGAIAAWAWGLLAVAKSIREPVIFVGHSRMGKAALLAGAFGGDGVIPIQTGCGGVAPSRTDVGETVEQITTRFPHWFLPEYASYAGREEELSFDQHELLALCAPKLLLLLNADDDLWANPAGQEAMAELARPIYASLGAGDAIGYRRRPGGHSVTPEDWSMILDFARSHW
jgi:hypothetical protein